MNNRLPPWFRQDIPDATTLQSIDLLSRFNINTVCRQAKCPNLGFCFKNSRLTFMILGNVCTRNCLFCAVTKGRSDTLQLDRDEPYRVSQIVKLLDLKYVVITSVTRDDLSDGGAAQFAKTIELIHRIDKHIKIEVLIPDFFGSLVNLKTVVTAGPNVVAHNIETIKQLYKELRPKASYAVALDILNKVKEINAYLITKSSLILGLGETEEEVIQTMKDLRDVQCDILVLGQYLAPSKNHYPVKEFISIEQFMKYRQLALALGFKAVLAGPKVRSSYQAEEVYREVAYV